PDRELRKIVRLPQLCDEVHRIMHTEGFLTFSAQRVDAREPHAKKNSVKIRRQLVQRKVAAQRLVIIDGDPANIRDVVNFRLCEIIRRLVGCDTVLVQSAGLGLRLKNGDVMPVNGQSMGSSQTSRSGPDDCDAAAGRTTTFIELL